MIKSIIIILTVGALTACSTKPSLPTPEDKLVGRVEYIIRIPPAELLEIPQPPANIDIETATQASVARWIIANEQYIAQLKNHLAAIAKFLTDEQAKADNKAREENANERRK